MTQQMVMWKYSGLFYIRVVVGYTFGSLAHIEDTEKEK